MGGLIWTTCVTAKRLNEEARSSPGMPQNISPNTNNYIDCSLSVRGDDVLWCQLSASHLASHGCISQFANSVCLWRSLTFIFKCFWHVCLNVTKKISPNKTSRQSKSSRRRRRGAAPPKAHLSGLVLSNATSHGASLWGNVFPPPAQQLEQFQLPAKTGAQPLPDTSMWRMKNIRNVFLLNGHTAPHNPTLAH